MTTEEIKAAAIAENLANPDGSEITTEEQLTAARELAKENPPEETPETPEEKAKREEEEAAAALADDPLTKAMLDSIKTQEQLDKAAEEPIEAAPESGAERAKNIATLKEWGVTMPDDATDDAIAAKVAEGKPVSAAAPPALPAKKGKRFSVVKKEHEAIIEPPPAPPVNTPPPAPPAPDADAEYVKTLTDEQKDELYEAEVAEMLEPVKFKGQRAKLVEFYKRFDREVQEITTAEPDTKLEESDKFKTLCKAKPVLDAVIIKKVNREIGSREGERRAETKLSPKIQEMEMTTRRIELAPKFQKFVVEEFKPGVNVIIEKESDPKSPFMEAFAVIKEKGVAEAKKEGYELEAQIYDEETKAAGERAEALLLLKNNAVKYDAKNPVHAFLIGDGTPENQGFIEREGRFVQDYEAKNNKRIVDPQRKFLTRMEFVRMLQTNPAEAATLDARAWKTKSFCTFTDTVLLDSLARNAKLVIELRLKQATERAAAAGFERRPRGKNTPAATPPKKPATEINPPRAVPAAANGAGNPAEVQEIKPAIDVLGINYPTMKRR